jgi:hypothetical protein
MAVTRGSFNDGNNTEILTATGADAALLDALPDPGRQSDDSLGRWSMKLGGGKYIVPFEVIKNVLNLVPKP